MSQVLGKSDIAIGVFTSSLNLPARALSVQLTWLREFPFGFLIGGYHLDPTLKMISAGSGVGEDYQSATKKQFLGLKRLIERHPDSLWFYITGCDAFIFSENLIRTLSQFCPDKDYFIGGHCNKITVNETDLIYPSGGPGFALSRSLAMKIYPFLEEVCLDWESSQTIYKSACDAALAYYLRQNFDVSVSFVHGFYALPPYKYPGNSYLDGDGNKVNLPVLHEPIAFHYLSIREMYLLNDRGTVEAPTRLEALFDRFINVLAWKLKLKRFPNLLCIIAVRLAGCK